MSYTTNISQGYKAIGAFNGSETVVIQNLAFSLIDSLTGYSVAVDDIYATVTDANNGTIIIDSDIESDDSFLYWIDSIDVTGYPAGNIFVDFTASLDGYTYTNRATIEYGTTIPVIITSGLTTTKTNRVVTLNNVHQFVIKTVDGAGASLDGYAARFIVYDLSTAAIVETVEASLTLAGTGLWSSNYTLNSNTYTASLNRYQLYWEWKATSGGSWFFIEGSRELLEVHDAASAARTGSLGYCTIDDVRLDFLGIDQYLSAFAVSQPERDLLLRTKIQRVSEEIHNQTHNTKAAGFPELLKQWCSAQVVYDLIANTAGSLGRYADSNLQLTNLKQRIFRIKQGIFGRMRTIPIQDPRR